jgi:predicted cupin superfamily sugar epimerase
LAAISFQVTTLPESLIKRLGLIALDYEGGYFRQTFQSSEEKGGRSLGTAIYYLVTPNDISKWHRNDCDEIYHFYSGDPLELFFYSSTNGLSKVELGPDLNFQYLIPKGTWQASRPSKTATNFGYSLIGATCVPGYTQSGFEILPPEALAQWLASDKINRDVILTMAGSKK